jgi:septum site-determining protein MinC
MSSVSFKSQNFVITSLGISSLDMRKVEEDLIAALEQGGGFIKQQSMIIDLSLLQAAGQSQRMVDEMYQLTQRLGLRVIAFTGIDSKFSGHLPVPAMTSKGVAKELKLEQSVHGPAEKVIVEKVVEKIVVQEVPVAAPSELLERPLRSGQQVYARGGDMVVLSSVSHGAEIYADGNVHVWGSVKGRIVAGAQGNQQAKILLRSLEAEIVAIAGVFKRIDEIPAQYLNGKPVEISLQSKQLHFKLI